MKFGVPPTLIPDYLALVGDAADGFPGIPLARTDRRIRTFTERAGGPRLLERSRKAAG